MAKRKRTDDVKLPAGLRAALPALALMALSLPAIAQPAPNARPSGSVVTGGSATISQGPTTTTISQSSQRAAINWQSFNIGSNQTVDFVQPNASAIALNHVVGPNPSEIAGHIDANGQVVIVNQAGVIFYKGAQVNTAGLVVSAASISTTSFMDGGKLTFNQAANPNAKVVNRGAITIADAGLAALVAPQVVNSGTITANLGRVVLAGAKTETLDLFGDGLVSLAVTNQVTQKPNGATALVTNSGTITARNGTIELTAKAADGVIQKLIKAGGTVHASKVVLSGVGGSIVVTGKGYPPQ